MIHLLFRTGNVVCSVHEQADHDANVMTRGEELLFLREGFSWPVALFPPLGLLMRGAWLGLLIYVILASAILGGLEAIGVNAAWGLMALLGLGIILGFESPALERWRLSRSGWHEIAVVSGANIEECERRFFEGWMRAQAPAATPTGVTEPRPVGLLRRLFAARP
jgi:hypothetical protein